MSLNPKCFKRAGLLMQGMLRKNGKTEAALKMAKLRLKKEWRELLRGEIAKTVTSLEEVDDELRALFEAFSSQHQVSV